MEKLIDIIKDSSRVFISNIPEKYNEDCGSGSENNCFIGKADAVVIVKNTDEVSKIMKFAYDNNIKVTPRGAATGLSGGAIPHLGGIVIDLSQMDKIIEIEPETFTATIEPGVLLKTLRTEVEKQNLFYPPDPGSKEASIGGNISTNAGGMRAVKYGTTKDYIRGLEVVLADGKIINLGSKNAKDSTGLQLKYLFTAAEGTLGIITKCIVKLLPLPSKTITTVFAFSDMKSGIETINKIMLANVDPVTVEFLEGKLINLAKEYSKIEFPFPDKEAYMIVSYDGYALDEKIRKSKRIAEEQSAEFLELTTEQEKDIWKMRGEASEAIRDKHNFIESVDIVVPVNKIPQFIDKINELCEEIGTIAYTFGHAGDGNIHSMVIKDNIDSDKINKLFDDLYEYIYNKLGGLTSGEHGIGLVKKKHFIENTDPSIIELMNEIKRVFDPKGILNAEKVYS
ncbi:MAG: FAD-binding protein [Rickettsiales bacterium]|jgi:glycolate oxidase|nr:FAD-binding protein [Rickettsiales bacterium]